MRRQPLPHGNGGGFRLGVAVDARADAGKGHAGQLVFGGEVQTVAVAAGQQFRLAIVNAANSGLLSGGGVDGAIHRAGGPAILEECRLLRASLEYKAGLPTGEAVITTGGRLPAAHVIHTMGPVWHGGHEGEPELLARCYRNSLHLAAEHQLASVAFSGISTGIYS